MASAGFRYQLVGADSETDISLIELDTFTRDICSGDHVVEVTMKVAQRHISSTFGVLVTDGRIDKIDSPCLRTDLIAQKLQVLQPNYQYASDVLQANSVGNVLGMTLPVSNPLRVKELIDIFTQSSQVQLDTDISTVRTDAITKAKQTICGIDSSNSLGVSFEFINSLNVSGKVDEERKHIAVAMLKHLDPTFVYESSFNLPIDASNEFTAPPGATDVSFQLDSSNNPPDLLIKEIIRQANQSVQDGFTNNPEMLFGADVSGGPPVPVATDVSGVKALYLLNFQVGDVLTFKNTVSIASNPQPIVINFNLTVVDNNDTDLDNHLVLGIGNQG
jgi:hypothetical protein